ncbi:unnamed protein product [Rotaria magnacalcarata]|uniref:Uncharacterized protein n=1 Tax=Rotaria magnacalcarata TaxID=392030 RepID=A0A815NDU6_9BILA|nr:unnamed protein product [Rotaria magnacalcarata]
MESFTAKSIPLIDTRAKNANGINLFDIQSIEFYQYDASTEVFACAIIYTLAFLQVNGRNVDASAALNRAAEILNISPPINWADYMGPPVTSGSNGFVKVDSSQLEAIMKNWSIPKEVFDSAVQSVRLLTLRAIKTSYIAQVFKFNTHSVNSISTLLVAVRMASSSTTLTPLFEIKYVTINTRTEIKKQSVRNVQTKCKRCNKCLWARECCCEDIASNQERDSTPEELDLIIQKMTSDQYTWFIKNKV